MLACRIANRNLNAQELQQFFPDVPTPDVACQ
jgi:hypothetical protein